MQFQGPDLLNQHVPVLNKALGIYILVCVVANSDVDE